MSPIRITKERDRVIDMHGMEIPPPAIITDSQFISPGSGQISLSRMNKQSLSLETMQSTADRNIIWSTAQNEKQNRILRDLQFELANNSIANLRAIRSNTSDRVNQIQEITAFESRLPKDEFSCYDGAAASLCISYENGKTFLDRIESDARKKCHFDSETSSFVTKLKARITDKRNISLEKERRRKKAIANQTTSSLHCDHSLHIMTVVCGKETNDDSSDDDSRDDVDQEEDEREAVADKSMQIFAEQIRMQHLEGDHKEKHTNVLQAQMRRSADKKIRNYEYCRQQVLNLVSSIECYGCQNSEDEGMQSSSGASEKLLHYIDMKLKSANSANPNLSATCYTKNSIYECSVQFYLISSNTGRWDFIPEITRDGQNMGTGSIHEQDVAPPMGKIPRYLESSRSILEELLEVSCADASNNISLALDLEEQRNLDKDSVILILRGGPSACVASADILRTVRWMGGSAMLEVWDVAAAVEVGRTLAHLLEGKTNKILVPVLVDIFLKGSAFAETSPNEYEAFESLASVTVEPSAVKVIAEIAETAMRILTSSHLIVPSATSTAKADVKIKTVAPAIFYTDITFGIILGQVLWLRNYVKALYMGNYAAPATLESSGTVTPPLPKSCPFAPIVLACSCIHAVTALAERDSASFALAFDWFLRGGTRESLHDSAADSAWKKLLKDAAATEGDVVSVTNKNRKEKGFPKIKNSCSEVEAKGYCAIGCMLRVVHSPDVQINSVDVTELELKGNPALRHEASRLIISTYYSTSGEVKSDRNVAEDDALELIIQQSAASLDTQYFQLLLAERLSEHAPTVYHQPTEFSLVCSAGLSVSETLLAVALNCGNSQCEKTSQASSFMSATLDPAEVGPSMRGSIVASIADRRERLTEAEQLWLCHISGANPVDFNSVHNALNLISNSIVFDTEMTGTVLMAFSHSVSLFEKEFLSREAVIRSSLLISDPRFKDVYSQLLEHLSSINSERNNRSKGCPTTEIESRRFSEDSSLLISDCLCLLGDVIDDRHMRWISLAAVQRVALEHHMQTFIAMTSRVSSQLAAVICSAYAMKARSAAAFTDLLSSLKCTSRFWALPHSGSQAPRWAMEVRRDRLRAKSQQLAQIYSSCGGVSGSAVSNEGTESRDARGSESKDIVDPWSDVIFLDHSLPSAVRCGTDMSLEENVQNELRAEALERAASLLSGLIVVLTTLQIQLKNHHETMQKMIVDRYRYEHGLLAQWAKALKASIVASNGCLTIPTTSCYFDVVDTADPCDLPPRISVVAELGDLILSFRSLQELSKLMTHDAKILGEILTEESCHTLLIRAVTEINGEQVCSAWRVARLTELLVRRVIESSGGGKAPYDCMVGGAFVKSVIMTIFIASVPVPPQQDFILHLGTLLDTLCQQDAHSLLFLPQNRPSLESFKRIILADATLLSIWCGKVALSDNAIQALNDMVDALLAVALCCLDADGRLIEEQVLFLLCYSPPSIRTRPFERALFMRGDVSSEMDHLPPMQIEGLCKALALASKIGDVYTPLVSGGIESKLSSTQYDMLLQQASYGLPAVMSSSPTLKSSLPYLITNKDDDLDKEMDNVAAPIDKDLFLRCVPQTENPDLTEAAGMLRCTRGFMTTDLQVGQDFLDTIMKSGRTTIPFCVPIIR